MPQRFKMQTEVFIKQNLKIGFNIAKSLHNLVAHPAIHGR